MVKSHKKLILSIIFIALIGLIYLIIPRTSAPINSTDTYTIYDISSNISTDASTRHNVNIGDIDNNGTLDSIIYEETTKDQLWEDKYNLRWTLVLNNEPIYTCYNQLMCKFKAECIDLDNDNNNEIFIQVSPHVNSMPLEEYVVLKNTDNGWIELQNSNEFNARTDMIGSNAFPIYGYVGKEYPTMLDIVCEGFDDVEIIKVDTTNHYQQILDKYKDKKTSEYLYQYADSILNGEKYSCGQQIAETSAWGIQKLHTDNIDGHPCIVATHGLNSIDGGKYDSLGNVDIYFNYDTKGDIHIIKMSIQPNTILS